MGSRDALATSWLRRPLEGELRDRSVLERNTYPEKLVFAVPSFLPFRSSLSWARAFRRRRCCPPSRRPPATHERPIVRAWLSGTRHGRQTATRRCLHSRSARSHVRRETFVAPQRWPVRPVVFGRPDFPLGMLGVAPARAGCGGHGFSLRLPKGRRRAGGRLPRFGGNRRPVESPRRVHRDHHRPTVSHG